MCLVYFISFHPDNHGGSWDYYAHFSKEEMESPKSLDGLVRVGQQVPSRTLLEPKSPATSVPFSLYHGIIYS